MAKRSCYIAFFLCSIIPLTFAAAKCVKKDPCTCAFDEYSFISLSKVKPAKELFFQDAYEEVSYFFSGCENKDFKPKDFNLVADKAIPNVALVKCISKISNFTVPNTTEILSTITQTCNPIGYAQDIQFDLVSASSDQYQLVFRTPSSKESLPSIVLVCDTFNVTSLKILSKATNALSLFSPLVCAQHISHHELSGGSIFCIIFFVAALTYFIGGGLLMYFARGARGVEIIPNFEFWVALPGLMKDGLIYILSGCRPFTVSSAETYDRI